MRTIFGLILFGALALGLWAAVGTATAQEDTFRKVARLVDLSDYREGAIGNWLADLARSSKLTSRFSVRVIPYGTDTEGFSHSLIS